MWDRDDEDLEEDLDWDEDVEDDEDSEHASFVCEDCDYRWEIYLEEEDDEMDDTQYCPMCGSANTSQI
jgi:Zn finger protein HypA/HybF involved in hydrogenase expression